MIQSNKTNTLRYNPELCVSCGMCISVCPQGVFEQGEEKAVLTHADACMECGACQLNCPTGAITVDSGVGCAAAMIYSALKGKNQSPCGCGGDSPSCGGDSSCC